MLENKIERIEGIEELTHLNTLDLSFNKLTKLENLENQKELTDLWLNYNKLKHYDDFKEVEKIKDSLKTIYLQNNPVSMNPNYRQKIIELVPNIEQIDSFRRNVKYIITKNPNDKAIPILKC